MTVHTQVAPRLPARLGIVCRAMLMVSAFFMGCWLLPASTLAQDSPKGMVAFFPGTACPAGWSAPDYPKGRLIVATTRDVLVGRTFGGSPLGDREDRKHKHQYVGHLVIPSKPVCGICSCCNEQGAQATYYRMEGYTEPAATGLPFIQYLACEKN